LSVTDTRSQESVHVPFVFQCVNVPFVFHYVHVPFVFQCVHVAFMIQKLSREFCVAPENGLACPDVVFYLDVGDVQVAANRGAFGEEVYETQKHVKKVCEDFAHLPYWRRVDD